VHENVRLVQEERDRSGNFGRIHVPTHSAQCEVLLSTLNDIMTS
jgi:hypothetical protein